MELGTRLDLKSFVGDADSLERRLYRTWPLFHIDIFGQISLIFETFTGCYKTKYSYGCLENSLPGIWGNNFLINIYEHRD